MIVYYYELNNKCKILNVLDMTDVEILEKFCCRETQHTKFFFNLRGGLFETTVMFYYALFFLLLGFRIESWGIISEGLSVFKMSKNNALFILLNIIQYFQHLNIITLDSCYVFKFQF